MKDDVNDTLRNEGPDGVRARHDQAHKKAQEGKQANGQDKTDGDWPEPHPLPNSLLPVAAFNIDALCPDQIRPWIVDVCERMQCPPEFIVVSTMAGLGSLIGRKVAIRPKANDDWSVIPNQWAMIIGRPGVLKSPAMGEALRPLHALAAAAEEDHKKEMAAFDVMAVATKLRHEANLKQAAKILSKDRKADVSSLVEEETSSEPPTLKRYIANDTSVASLGVLLQQNPNGLLVFRDELVSLLDNLDHEENASERGFYLTGWSGDANYTFDRIGRGLHLSIDGICLSMLGSTQPGRIAQYLSRAIRGGRFDDGLIQRFGLMVWPDVSGEWQHVDRWPDREAKAEATRLYERVDKLDWRAVGAKRDRDPSSGDEEGLPYLRFGIEAYDTYTAWQTDLERRLRSGEMHVALEAHLSKYRKLVPGLSLICHLPCRESNAAQAHRSDAGAGRRLDLGWGILHVSSSVRATESSPVVGPALQRSRCCPRSDADRRSRRTDRTTCRCTVATPDGAVRSQQISSRPSRCLAGSGGSARKAREVISARLASERVERD